MSNSTDDVFCLTGFLFGYIIPWHADAMPASREFKEFMERRGVWPKGAKVELSLIHI